MGLDMYLYRKTYVQNWDWMNPEHKINITITQNGKPIDYIDIDKITYIYETVAYWRKANQIHKWFVDNCQNGVDDCGEYYVTLEQLRELLDICETIVANPARAQELLPTERGFFFGSTGYDEYYMEDIKNTIEQLTPLVTNNVEGRGSFHYHSSW